MTLRLPHVACHRPSLPSRSSRLRHPFRRRRAIPSPPVPGQLVAENNGDMVDSFQDRAWTSTPSQRPGAVHQQDDREARLPPYRHLHPQHQPPDPEVGARDGAGDASCGMSQGLRVPMGDRFLEVTPISTAKSEAPEMISGSSLDFSSGGKDHVEASSPSASCGSTAVRPAVPGLPGKAGRRRRPEIQKNWRKNSNGSSSWAARKSATSGSRRLLLEVDKPRRRA